MNYDKVHLMYRNGYSLSLSLSVSLLDATRISSRQLFNSAMKPAERFLWKLLDSAVICLSFCQLWTFLFRRSNVLSRDISCRAYVLSTQPLLTCIWLTIKHVATISTSSRRNLNAPNVSNVFWLAVMRGQTVAFEKEKKTFLPSQNVVLIQPRAKIEQTVNEAMKTSWLFVHSKADHYGRIFKRRRIALIYFSWNTIWIGSNRVMEFGGIPSLRFREFRKCLNARSRERISLVSCRSWTCSMWPLAMDTRRLSFA